MKHRKSRHSVRMACIFSLAGALSLSVSDGRAADEKGLFGLYEFNLGVLDHDTDNLWSGFNREDGVDINAEVLFGSLGSAVGGQVHPALGVSINTVGDTSKAYAGLRWRHPIGEGFFVGLGLGAAVHDGETDFVSRDRKALGSRVLWHIPVEAGFMISRDYAVSVYFDHVSNAYLADENEGMDTIGVRVGRRF